MDILCIGDSLTYGYGVGRPETWCAIASGLCGHGFVNRGVNGATTGEMREVALSGDAVFVMGGLNDLFMGMDIAIPLANIVGICEDAARLGLRPAVGIPMPISTEVDEGWCDGPVDIAKVRDAYAAFAEELSRLCAERGIPALDFRPVMRPSDLSFDGVHLNRQGHRRMAEAVADFWSARPSA